MEDRDPYPEREARDHVHNAGKAVAALAPWIGGAGEQLLSFYIRAGLEQRRDDWFRRLDGRLADVEGRVLGDPAFQTLVLQATRAALGTHIEEKLQLLAAAVRSSADVVARGGDGFMAMRLLRWVDELEPVHFEVLGAIRDDRGWGGQVGWQDVLARIPLDDEVWYQVLEDLTSRRLVQTTGYNPDRPAEEYRHELIWATTLGLQLVRFVQLMAEEEA